MSNEKNKDILRTFQPDFCKNLRTSKAQKESTGPYKIKKVYITLQFLSTDSLTYPVALHETE